MRKPFEKLEKIKYLFFETFGYKLSRLAKIQMSFIKLSVISEKEGIYVCANSEPRVKFYHIHVSNGLDCSTSHLDKTI